MATEAVERLYRLTLDAASAIAAAKKFSTSTDEAEKSLLSLDKAGAKANSMLADFGKGLLAALSVGAVVAIFEKAVSGLDELNDASQRVGMSVEDLSKWNYVASMSASSAEGFEAAAKKLSVNMGEIDDKTSKAGAALRYFGVTATDTTTEALDKLVAGFSKMEEGPKRTALAIQIFGKAGADMIPMLISGTDAIEGLREEAERLGLVMSSDAAQAAGDFKDNLDRMQKAAGAVATQFVEGMVPALTAVTSAWQENINVTDTWISTGRIAGDVILTLSEYIAKGTTKIQNWAIAWGALEMGWEAAKQGGGPALRAALRDGMSAIEANNAALDELMRKQRAYMMGASLGPSMSSPFMQKPAPTIDGGGGKSTKQKEAEDVKFLREQTEELQKAYDKMIDTRQTLTTIDTILQEATRKGITLNEVQYEGLERLAIRNDALAEAEKRRIEQEKILKQFADDQADVTKGWSDYRDAVLASVDPLAKLYKEQDDLQELMRRFPQDSNLINEAMKKNQKTIEETYQKMADGKDVWEEFGKTGVQGLTNGIVDMFDEANQSVDKFVVNTLRQMAKLLASSAIQGLLKMFAGSAGAGTWWGSIVSAAAGTRATGGPVAANRSYLVGEFGPEIATFPAAGRITNAANSASMGGDINTTINVDSSGSVSSAGDSIALAKQIEGAVRQVILTEKRPGGMLATG